ncbi:efflux transporter outer membrane subunit [Hyphococcus sp.]|uniref:efflux transporter outer membrane subunit n=1 Tax=Hyphococcus sp. TaxID=2038636 RepID=UPI00208D6B28|nr:MAG: RND transporter [Marinicaulis sp.]
MMQKTLLITAAFSVVSACASVSPPVSELTVMPSTYDFTDESVQAAKNESLWWRSFGDTQLDALISEALAANQNIAAGLAAVRASRASVQSANASLYPTLSAGASASSNTDGGLDDVSGSARTSTSYQLDLFGQNRASRAAAAASYDAQQFDQRALELTVESDVAFNYFSILAIRQRLDVARSNLEISERIYDIVRLRYDAGAVSSFDISSQEAALANARARIPQLEQQRYGFESALAILLGRTPQGYSAPQAEILALNPPSINPGLPSELLLRRPDLLSAEAQLRASDANVAAARAAFFPSIDLSAGLNAGLTGGASVIGSLASSLSAPIFSGGRLEGALNSAEARVDQQIARYRQSTLNALRDVDVSLKSISTAAQREIQLQVAYDASQKSLSLAEIRYRSGADDLTSLLNAQSTFFNASDSLAQGRLDRLSAAVDLYVAIGGGWSRAAQDL